MREVRDASRGLGREAFEVGLTDAGVAFRANVAATGRMNGYSFTLEGWSDARGGQVWVPASKVAKDLCWAALGAVIGDGPAPAEGGVAAARVEAAALRGAERLRQGSLERGAGQRGDRPALSTDPAGRLLVQ